MKSALIVDDHPVIRAALRLVLQGLGFKQIHEASDGNEVVPLIRQYQPKLLILDLNLPVFDGLEVMNRIRANNLDCRILVFTSHDPLYYQDRCLRAGAQAFVAKTNQPKQLQNAIEAVMSGHSYFASLASSIGALKPSHANEKHMIDQLSDRELNIFVQLALGKPNKKIAADMHLSHKTVSTYKTRLMLKLAVTSAVHLRDFAKRNHLI